MTCMPKEWKRNIKTVWSNAIQSVTIENDVNKWTTMTCKNFYEKILELGYEKPTVFTHV